MIGWGFVINSFAEAAAWNNWQGYLLWMLGGKEGPWAYGNIGVILALIIGYVVYLLASMKKIAAQENRSA